MTLGTRASGVTGTISPDLLAHADEAAKLELGEDSQLDTKKAHWLAMAEELYMSGEVPKEKVSQKVHDIIEERMRLMEPDEPNIRFTSRWYYVVMSDAGYVDPSISTPRKKSTDQAQSTDTSTDQAQSANTSINHELIQTCKKLQSYLKFLTRYAESLEYEVKDNIPQPVWEAYLDDMEVSAQILKDAIDEKTKVPQNSIHVFKAALQAESGIHRAAEIFTINRLELIRKRIGIITHKQAVKYRKGEEPNQLPIDEPDSATWALFSGFYGTQCPHCGSWRIKPIEGTENICIDCQKRSPAGKRPYCYHCQTPLYPEKLRTIKKTGKCPKCDVPIEIPEEVFARAV